MKKYGLIGGRLEHSFSPRIHSLLGHYNYGLYPIQPGRLDAFMRDNELNGFNVTIPYKTDVVPYCSSLSDRARVLGCVNTVIRSSDGSYYGDNTDYCGFMALLGGHTGELRGKKAVVLGSGGSSKTASAVLREAGAEPVIVVSRTGANNYGNISAHWDAELVVNTTPVGMYPDNGVSPIDLSDFTSCRLVLDLIYNPSKTRLLLQAERLGIPCRNGMKMLVAQAKAASELFQGRKLPDGLVAGITDTIARETKNVVLIGMPGSGKSTVGGCLARLTSRQFFDTDVLVAEAAGSDIPAIFASGGEGRFRELETQILWEVSKKSGAVIATGGGVVTVPENRELLMQNSVIIFIESDIKTLPKEGRPISQSRDMETLYRERQPLYEAWSDHAFFNNTPLDTALRIKEELGL